MSDERSPAPVAGAPVAGVPVRDVASIPVLLALLAVLAGLVAAALYAAPRPPGDGSAEVGFARDMSAHHQQAVAMAETIRDRTADPELRVLAADIALTQQSQIGRMSAWLDAWGVRQTSPAPRMAWMGTPTTGRMPGMAGPEDLAALRTLPVPQAEASFLRLMVAHHTGGVSMARAGSALVRDPQVRSLADGIVVAQAAEIRYFQSLLAARGQPPVTVPAEAGPAGDLAGDMAGDMAGGMAGGMAGDMAGDGPQASPSPREVALLSVVALGLIAAGWLLMDGVARHSGWRRSRVGAAGLVLTAAAGGSAVVHLALAPAHTRENLSYGLFFLFAGVIMMAGAVAVLAGLARAGAAVVGAASLLLVLAYVTFRIVPPPGAARPEHLDGWGMTAVAAELLAAGAAAVLLRRGGTRDRPLRAVGA